jgi:hypothetical protein
MYKKFNKQRLVQDIFLLYEFKRNPPAATTAAAMRQKAMV